MKFDAIIIGAGFSGMKAASVLAGQGRSCAVISSGLSLNPRILPPDGVTFLACAHVCSGEIEGSRVQAVVTDTLPDEKLCADIFVLATGKFASRGLVADKETVYEPIFGLDVLYENDRSKWFNPDFFAPQPFLKAGLKVDGNSHPYKDGKAIENLYAVGEILAGVSSIDGIEEIENSVSRISF